MNEGVFSKVQPVSVLFYYDGAQEYARPIRLLWKNIEYELDSVQFWYATHHDDKLVHHYTLTDLGNRYTFQLALETENLTWKLEQATALTVTAKRPLNYPLSGLVGAMG